MSKLDRIEKDLTEIKSKLNNKKRKFKLPFKVKRMMKAERKKPQHVLVQYLTRKYQIRWMLQPIVSGSLVVIDNKVHTLDPNKMWRFGKHMWYIIREIDRKPVSNRDYKRVIKSKDDTEADVPLIKAVLGAVQKPPMMPKKKMIAVIVILLVVAGIVAFILLG